MIQFAESILRSHITKENAQHDCSAKSLLSRDEVTFVSGGRFPLSNFRRGLTSFRWPSLSRGGIDETSCLEKSETPAYYKERRCQKKITRSFRMSLPLSDTSSKIFVPDKIRPTKPNHRAGFAG